MPRTIEFDRDQALADAMALFWRQGYCQTSMRDLTEATSLQPGSLYGAFGNKRALFLQSLDHYARALGGFVGATLYDDHRPPLERIRRFFGQLLDESVADPEHKGCFLVNTLMETPADDAELIEAAGRALARVERAFAEVLGEAVRRGTLPASVDVEARARLLMAGIFGMRVYSKMPVPQSSIGTIVDELLASALPEQAPASRSG